MREIKFRAWIKDTIETGEWEMCYDLVFDEFEPINDLLAGVEHLMQYTGLKDKNGKEIYESDIIPYKLKLLDQNTLKHKWFTFKGIVVWDDIKAGWRELQTGRSGLIRSRKP